MTSVFQEQLALFGLYQELRDDLMQVLSDTTLAFTPGGSALTLGSLCREIGETQQSYLDSFTSRQQDFRYRHPDPDIGTNLDRLRAWYAELDDVLATILTGFGPDDLVNAIIDRGGGFEVTIPMQLEIYKEALLLFYGKASIYLKVLQLEVHGRWQHWIG